MRIYTCRIGRCTFLKTKEDPKGEFSPLNERKKAHRIFLHTIGRCSISISSTILCGTWPTSPWKFLARHHFFELFSISISSPRRTVNSLLFCPFRSILTAQILQKTTKKANEYSTACYHSLGSRLLSFDSPGVLILHLCIVIFHRTISRWTIDRRCIEMRCWRRLTSHDGMRIDRRAIVIVILIGGLNRIRKRTKFLGERSIQYTRDDGQAASWRSSMLRVACKGRLVEGSWNHDGRPSKNTGR